MTDPATLKPRPRRWTLPWCRSLVGERVEVVGVERWMGRQGTVTRLVEVAAGGHVNTRTCLLIDLEARGRAAERTVTVLPSSVVPLE